MILVDATYLHSFGGKTILELILQSLLDSNIKFHAILDNRLDPKLVNKIQLENYTLISASHKNRTVFYLQNLNRFSSILCLANIPPPIHTSVKTSVFFHNCLI